MQIATGIFVFIVVGFAASFFMDSREHISFAAGIGNALIGMLALMGGLWLFIRLTEIIDARRTHPRVAVPAVATRDSLSPLNHLPPEAPDDVDGEALRLVEMMGPRAAVHARQCASVYSALGDHSNAAGWRTIALLCDVLLRPSAPSDGR